MEINNVNENISPVKNTGFDIFPKNIDSKFVFDLRDIAKSSNAMTESPVNGILTLTEKPSPVSELFANRVNTQTSNRISGLDKFFSPKNYAGSNSVDFNNGFNSNRPFIVEDSIKSRFAMTPNNNDNSGGKTTAQTFFNSEKISSDNTPTTPNNQNGKVVSSERVFKPGQSEKMTAGEKSVFSEHSKANGQTRPSKQQNQTPVNQTEGTKPIDSDNLMSGSMKTPGRIDAAVQSTSDSPVPAHSMELKIDELKSSITSAIDKQMTSVKIKLHPDNLGSVNVKLVWKGNDISIGLTTENKDAANILNSNLTELKGGLESANLKIRDINVTIDDNRQNGNFRGSQDFSNQSQNGNRQEQKNAQLHELAKTTKAALSPTKATISGSPVILNPRGRIDLKA
jgi:flagellar hook-length control protein FliK